MPRKPAVPGVDRRQQILDAALDVFAERGFDGATTQEIADRADVAQGLIYFYFKAGGKVQLLPACDRQTAVALAQLDERAQGEQDLPTDAALEHMVSRFVRVLDAPRTGKLLNIMAREEGRLRPHAQGEDNDTISLVAIRIYDELENFLCADSTREQVSKGDASLAANLFTGSLVALMVRRALHEPNASYMTREDISRMLAEMVGAWLAARTGQIGIVPAGESAREASE